MEVKRYTFPGFIDVHVHFRDPGVPEAETTASGLSAAARGGFGAVVVMPNTLPPIDSAAAVREQYAKERAANSPVRMFSSACISAGRAGNACADLEALAEAGAAFFTDDGTFVGNDKVMEEAMRRAADLNMVLSQHALAPGMSEADCIRRDLSLCRETGCRLHIQHISTAEGVELVRSACKEGLPITAEATPHHLLLTRDDVPSKTSSNSSFLVPHSSFYKMAPPLAGREDRAEVRRGVKDGLLMFATDHAPHPAASKLVPYERAANGIIGLETAISITYQVMVEEEGMSVEDWAAAWWKMPRDILAASATGGSAALDGLAKTTVEIGQSYKVDVSSFASLSRNCPYDGLEFNCRAVAILEFHDFLATGSDFAPMK